MKRWQAFTLVETVIGLIILAMLGAVILGFTQFNRHAVTKVTQQPFEWGIGVAQIDQMAQHAALMKVNRYKISFVDERNRLGTLKIMPASRTAPATIHMTLNDGTMPLFQDFDAAYFERKGLLVILSLILNRHKQEYVFLFKEEFRKKDAKTLSWRNFGFNACTFNVDCDYIRCNGQLFF